MGDRAWIRAQPGRPCPLCGGDRLCSWINKGGTLTPVVCSRLIDATSALAGGVTYHSTKTIMPRGIDKPCRVFVAERREAWIGQVRRDVPSDELDGQRRARVVAHAWARASKHLGHAAIERYLHARGVPLSAMPARAIAEVGFDEQSIDETRLSGPDGAAELVERSGGGAEDLDVVLAGGFARLPGGTVWMRGRGPRAKVSRACPAIVVPMIRFEELLNPEAPVVAVHRIYLDPRDLTRKRYGRYGPAKRSLGTPGGAVARLGSELRGDVLGIAEGFEDAIACGAVSDLDFVATFRVLRGVELPSAFTGLDARPGIRVLVIARDVDPSKLDAGRERGLEGQRGAQALLEHVQRKHPAVHARIACPLELEGWGRTMHRRGLPYLAPDIDGTPRKADWLEALRLREPAAMRRVLRRDVELARQPRRAPVISGRFFRTYHEEASGPVWRALRPSSRELFLTLARLADNDTRAAIVSVHQLGLETGLSRRTVQLGIKELERAALVRIVGRQGGCSVYMLPQVSAAG